MSIYRKVQIHLPVFGLLKRVPSQPNPRHVLIICDDAMGDLLMLSGVLKYLKDQGYATTLVVREGWKELAAHMWAEHVICVNIDLYRQSLRYRVGILNQVRHTRYAWAAVSIFPSAISANILSYCGAVKRCAFRWGNDWLSRRRLFFVNHKITPLPLKPSEHIHRDILELLAHYYTAILGGGAPYQIPNFTDIRGDGEFTVAAHVAPSGLLALYFGCYGYDSAISY